MGFVVTALCAVGIGAIAVAPAVAAGTVTYTVTSVLDAPLASGATTTCISTAPGRPCTLRAAVDAADNQPSGTKVTIDLPEGYFALTIPAGTPGPPKSGTLALTGGTDVAIVGAGSSTTDIEGTSTFDDTVFSVGSGETLALDDVTVSGGKTTSDGGDIYDDGTVTLTDAAVTDGFAEGSTSGYGGGVYVAAAATLTVQDSEIEGNQGYYGGAVYIDGGTVSVKYATVSGNTGEDGAGVFVDGGTLTVQYSTVFGNHAFDYGGGIYNNGTLTLDDVDLEGNYAYDYGGGLCNTVVATLTNVTVKGNTSYEYGGGISNYDGKLTVDDSTIIGNFTTYYGGGIYNFSKAPMTITSSTISGNDAYEEGGGLLTDHQDPTIRPAVVENSKIDGNYAYYYGGGTSFWSTGTMTRDSFSGNHGDYYGGALYVYKTSVDVSDSTFVGNAANEYGGVAYLTADASVTSLNDTYSGNSTFYYGGGYYLSATGDLVSSFDTFAANTDTDEAAASIDHAVGSTVEVRDDVFDYGYGPECSSSITSKGDNVSNDTSCGLTGTGDHQGADAALMPLGTHGGPVDVRAIGTSGSPALNVGGASATCTDALGDTVTADALGQARPSTFGGTTGCDAGADQITALPPSTSAGTGGTYTAKVLGTGTTSSSTCSVTGQTALCPTLSAAIKFANSVAPTEVTVDLAGGYYALKDTVFDIETNTHITLAGLSAENTEIEGDVTTEHGNLFDVAGADTVLALRNLTVDGGKDAYEGGDVYDSGAFGMDDAALTGGVATYGGDLFVASGAHATINAGAVVTTGVASDAAGGIYGTRGRITIDGGDVADDAADDAAGGIYEYGATATIKGGATISGNFTATSGGGLYVYEGTLEVADASLTGNAGGYGGGLVLGQSDATVTGARFTGNASYEEGGAIDNDGVLDLRYSTLVGNSTTYYGGAIYNTATLTVSTSTIEGNGSYYEGGAMYNDGVATLTEVGLYGNNVYEYGGGYYNKNTLSVHGSTFFGNGGSYYGGAAYAVGTTTISDSTFIANSSYEYGGAFDVDGTVHSVNDTFYANSADEYGATFYGSTDASLSSSYDTFAGNAAFDDTGGGDFYDRLTDTGLVGDVLGIGPTAACNGPLVNATYTVTADSSCGFSRTGDQTDVDPDLLPPNYDNWPETMAIGSPWSPAVNVLATGTACPDGTAPDVSTDERGVTRPTTVRGTQGCDAGAYQLEVATASVSGTQQYGGHPSFEDMTPSSPTVTGTVTCTEVTVGGTPVGITPTLKAGSYRILPTSCIGLSTAEGLIVTYVSATADFTVTKADIVVKVSGTKPIGSNAHFTYTAGGETTVLTGTLVCTEVTSATRSITTLSIGTYTLKASTCSGLSTAHPTSATITYDAVATGFQVTPPLNIVYVSGTMPYHGTPTFSFTVTKTALTQHPTGTVTCTKAGGQPLDTLTVGTYPITVTSCSGLTASPTVQLKYESVGTSFDVYPASITVFVYGYGTRGTVQFTWTVSTSTADITGSLTCTDTVNDTSIQTLGAGTYTITSATCSGLSVTGNYEFTYEATPNDLTITPVTVDVTVRGSQTYGGTPTFTWTSTTSDQGTADIAGTVTCTKVDHGSETIGPDLDVGTYTITASSCSGLTTNSTYRIYYENGTENFSVTKATITASVSGSQVVGGTPSFSYAATLPGTETLNGSLSCTALTGGATTISKTLAVGTYTIEGSSCSGLTPSDPTNASVTFSGVTTGYVVSKTAVTVVVSGHQQFGGAAHVTYTLTPPTTGAEVTGTLTCTEATTGAALGPTLAVGSYTVKATTCSGLSATADYALKYEGAADGYTVGPTTVTAVVSGTMAVGGSASFTYTLQPATSTAKVTGTVSCTKATGRALASLAAGTYTLTGVDCSGLAATADFTVSYSGKADGFTVTPGQVIAIVAGSMDRGGTAIFTYTVTPPTSGAVVSGTLSCTKASGTALATLLPGHYTLTATTCSGLTVTASHTLRLESLSTGFVVNGVLGGSTIVATPTGGGYWTVTPSGQVHPYGNAKFYGSMANRPLNEGTYSMAATPTGKGYWLAGSDGGVFCFGSAQFYGSLPGLSISVSDIVDIVATPGGRGYWLVGADGGIYAFGNAGFYGSVPQFGITNPQITAMAASPTGHGYLLVGLDGGVYAFGNASFHGSLPGLGITDPLITAMAGTPSGKGYLLVGQNGGVYAFGDATYEGSLPALGVAPAGPVTGMAMSPTARGYWLVSARGGVYAFGAASYDGSPG